MRRIPAVLALGLTLGINACGDTTGPQRLVDGRVAHAIPGAGPVTVSVDLAPTFQLQPLDHTYYVVTAAPRTFDFALATQILSLQVQHDRDITAIILLDLDGPALRAYHLDRDDAEQRIAVVNAYPGPGNLHVAIDGPDSSFSLNLAPAEAQSIEPFAEAFTISVQGDTDDEGFTLSPFTLQVGDYGFLVIVPGPTQGEPYRWMLF